MRKRDLGRFVAAQLNAIYRARYLASEKAGKDLRFDDHGNITQKFYVEWVKKNSLSFREAWKKSKCKKCQSIFSCGDVLRDQCPQFVPDFGLIHKFFKKV